MVAFQSRTLQFKSTPESWLTPENNFTQVLKSFSYIILSCLSTDRLLNCANGLEGTEFALGQNVFQVWNMQTPQVIWNLFTEPEPTQGGSTEFLCSLFLDQLPEIVRKWKLFQIMTVERRFSAKGNNWCFFSIMFWLFICLNFVICFTVTMSQAFVILWSALCFLVYVMIIFYLFFVFLLAIQNILFHQLWNRNNLFFCLLLDYKNLIVLYFKDDFKLLHNKHRK